MFIYKDLQNTIDKRPDTSFKLEPIFRDVGDGKVERVAMDLNINYALTYADTIRIKLKEGQSIYTDTFDFLLNGGIFNIKDMGDYWTVPHIVHKMHFFNYFNNLNLEELGDQLTPDFMDIESRKFHSREIRIDFLERLSPLYNPIDTNDMNLEMGRDPNRVSKKPIGKYRIKVTNGNSETISTIDFEESDISLEFEPMGEQVYTLVFRLVKSKNEELSKVLTDNLIHLDVFDENKDRITMAITPSTRWSDTELFQVFKTNIVREILGNI